MNEAVGVLEAEGLKAYVGMDRKGSVEVVGFRTYNDGLETVIDVQYVAGSPNLSRLALGLDKDQKAVKGVSCRKLK